MKALDQLDPVVGLSVQCGASSRRKGDDHVAHLLNRAADDVLPLVGHISPDISVVTAETSSTDPLHDAKIADDVIWKELETGLRQQGRATPNSLALMVLGGTLGTASMVSEGVPPVGVGVCGCLNPLSQV